MHVISASTDLMHLDRFDCRGYNCTQGVPYIVEGLLTKYLRFSHVVCMCGANFMVCKKIVPSNGSHLKVNIKSIKEAKCLLFGTSKDRMSTFVILISHRFTFVILISHRFTFVI